MLAFDSKHKEVPDQSRCRATLSWPVDSMMDTREGGRALLSGCQWHVSCDRGLMNDTLIPYQQGAWSNDNYVCYHLLIVCYRLSKN